MLANGNLRPIESNQTPAKESLSLPRVKPRLLAADRVLYVNVGRGGSRGR